MSAPAVSTTTVTLTVTSSAKIRLLSYVRELQRRTSLLVVLIGVSILVHVGVQRSLEPAAAGSADDLLVDASWGPLVLVLFAILLNGIKRLVTRPEECTLTFADNEVVKTVAGRATKHGWTIVERVTENADVIDITLFFTPKLVLAIDKRVQSATVVQRLVEMCVKNGVPGAENLRR